MNSSVRPSSTIAADLSRVTTLVCEPSGLLRQGIRLALNNLGIRSIIEANSFIAAHNSCKETSFDLVVINRDMEDNDASFMLSDMRVGKLGDDPFAVSVMLLSAPDELRVKSAINSGADDLLLVPFAPDQLMTRLSALAQRRKPFVVTHDYIGPDRRKASRPGETSATRFTVPNPVQARMHNHPLDAYRRHRGETQTAISVERIKRLALHLEWETQGLLAASRDGRLDGEMAFHALYKLETISDELVWRIGNTMNHGTANIEAFLDSCRTLKQRPSKLSHADIETLHGAARRIAGTYATR